MTFQEARDVICGIFFQAWKPLGFPVVWTDVPSEVPTGQTVWSRVVIRHEWAEQGSLGDFQGKKRWDRSGTVFCQIFSPVGEGSKTLYDVAQIVVDAFQASRHPNVWFRNIQLNEAGSDGAFEQINVTANFQYDDVR